MHELLPRTDSGRHHSLYEPHIVARIVRALRVGMPPSVACKVSLVSERTYGTWKQRYPEFAAAVQQAQADYTQELFQTVLDGMKKEPSLAFKMIERRFPEEFGRRSVTRHEGVVQLQAAPAANAPDLSKLDREDLATLRALYAKVGADGHPDPGSDDDDGEEEAADGPGPGGRLDPGGPRLLHP